VLYIVSNIGFNLLINKIMKNEKLKSEDLNMFKRINTYLSIILIGIGLLVVLVTLYLKPDNLSCIPDIGRLLYSFFELLGFTLFTSGIFVIFLQLPDWQKYFEERLKHIVMEQDYLNSLDHVSLSNLQVKTLKAYFQTSDIDKEGSFLNYFQDNISQYINQPYRDDVKTEINVIAVENDGYIVSDRIIYNCRMVGGKIQDFIKWKPDKDEFIEIRSVVMNVKRKDSDIKEVLRLESHGADYLINNEKSITLNDIFKSGLTCDIKEYNEDGLFIEIKSVYKIEKGKFFNWSMAHPTRNFYIAIHYPDNCSLQFQHLLSHPDKVIINDSKGLFTMQYKEWLLPYSGVVYSFSSVK